MSESELGQALVACDATTGNDARQMIERVLERDRRRVRLLATWALVLWALIVVGVLFLVWFFFMALQPKLWAFQADQNSRNVKTWITMSSWAAWSIAAFATMMMLAGACTVWLVFASRRAMLRQLNAQLSEVSEQLRQLQQTPAKPTETQPEPSSGATPP